MSNRFRKKSISIRVTDAEFSLVQSKVVQSKLSAREFIIRCITNKEIIIKEGGMDIVKELKRIGNNINQLSYNANIGKLYNCNKELNSIYTELRRLMKEWQ